jgi:hypothetical protein
MDDPDLTVGIGSDIDLPPRSSPPVRQPVDEKLQRLLDKALYGGGHQSAQRIRNFLNGTWLGEPLHVVLTDVPVGAWTVAMALDALDLIFKPARVRAGVRNVNRNRVARSGRRGRNRDGGLVRC